MNRARHGATVEWTLARRSSSPQKAAPSASGVHTVTAGKLPRVTRLMALALKFQSQIQEGVIADYAELARLGLVTRARATQIMNLLHLASDIQEEILFLPRTTKGRDPVTERDLRAICRIVDWDEQRHGWRKLSATVASLRN